MYDLQEIVEACFLSTFLRGWVLSVIIKCFSAKSCGRRGGFDHFRSQNPNKGKVKSKLLDLYIFHGNQTIPTVSVPFETLSKMPILGSKTYRKLDIIAYLN